MRPCQLLAVSGAAALIAIGGCHSSPAEPTPPPPVCVFQLTVTSSSVGADGGAASISVSTGASCAWSARTDATWVTIQSGASGTGPGTIALAIAANVEPAAREGTVIVADQSVKLSQQGRAPCEYAIAPADARFDADGGPGLVTVTAPPHCAWTAASSDPWVALAVTAGTGAGVVHYTVAEWSGAAERTATIRVADTNIAIRQSRDPHTCAYSVTPIDLVLHWHGPGGQIQITTDADCAWTARSTVDWLQLSGATSRSGPGVLQFDAPSYTADATRRAPLEIRWPAPSAGQNVWVTQEGCRYGAYPSSVTVAAAGGSEYINVLTQPISPSCSLGCPWSAEPSASWIRIASGSPGSGDDRFRFEVGPNTGAARSATIRVGGQTVMITQAGS